MKSFLAVLGIVAAILLLSLVGFLAKFIFMPVNMASDIITTENAIYNYEWFIQQHEDIQALEGKITIAENSVISFESMCGDDRTLWTFEDKTEDSRLRSVAQGLRSQYETVVANYNARSNMATRNIFEDGMIPNSLEAMASIIN